jgi:hypothetical protein
VPQVAELVAEAVQAELAGRVNGSEQNACVRAYRL